MAGEKGGGWSSEQAREKLLKKSYWVGARELGGFDAVWYNTTGYISAVCGRYT